MSVAGKIYWAVALFVIGVVILFAMVKAVFNFIVFAAFVSLVILFYFVARAFFRAMRPHRG